MDAAFSGFRRRARIAALLPAVVVVVAAAVIGAFVGGLVASSTVVIGAITALAVGWWLTVQRGTSALIAVSGEESTPTPNAARAANLLEGLCLSNGVNVPVLRIVDDAGANAAVISTGRETATLVLTTGLVESLDRIELEGVIAALLVRVRSGEAILGGRLTMWLARPRPQPRDGAMRRSGPASTRRLISWAVGEGLFTAIDEQACQMTRYPPGLISAYEKMGLEGTVTGSALADAPHLWIMPPSHEVSAAPETARRGVHPPLAERLNHLREL